MRTRVKICGITRPQDALAAARHGADAIGLVFYAPSPRAVDIATARAIVRVLPPFVSVVALFVNAAADQIRSVLSEVSVDLLQFHGDELPQDCEGFGKPWIKAVAMREDIDLTEVAARYRGAAGLLVDAYHPGVAGGTGEVFDWSRIPATLGLPLVLAGGLSPDNVTRAIQQVQPYAVDVSSGVERHKGIKDEDKVAMFIRAVSQS